MGMSSVLLGDGTGEEGTATTTGDPGDELLGVARLLLMLLLLLQLFVAEEAVLLLLMGLVLPFSLFFLLELRLTSRRSFSLLEDRRTSWCFRDSWLELIPKPGPTQETAAK
jgi:hypothetical protein